jgi:uncharacterized protein (TIGR03435 family)
MRWTPVRVVAGLLAFAASGAAQPADSVPSFEVASVKPSLSGSHIGVLIPADGKLLASDMPLRHLIGFAYRLPDEMVSGPSWLDSSRCDIVAKATRDASDSQLRLMTQSLLAQRFGLQAHHETKEGPVYFLVPASGRWKVLPAGDPRSYPAPPPGPYRSMGGEASMEEFGAILTNYVGRAIIDQTGTTGKFYVKLWWAKDPDADPDIFSALQEQLGLKLKPGRGQIDRLVVDRINKTPTEN